MQDDDTINMPEEEEYDATLIFETICNEVESLTGFVTVVLDENGSATVGGMNLNEQEMADVLSMALNTIRGRTETSSERTLH